MEKRQCTEVDGTGQYIGIGLKPCHKVFPEKMMEYRQYYTCIRQDISAALATAPT
jgi:hypothetical protein